MRGGVSLFLEGEKRRGREEVLLLIGSGGERGVLLFGCGFLLVFGRGRRRGGREGVRRVLLFWVCGEERRVGFSFFVGWIFSLFLGWVFSPFWGGCSPCFGVGFLPVLGWSFLSVLEWSFLPVLEWRIFSLFSLFGVESFLPVLGWRVCPFLGREGGGSPFLGGFFLPFWVFSSLLGVGFSPFMGRFSHFLRGFSHFGGFSLLFFF